MGHRGVGVWVFQKFLGHRCDAAVIHAGQSSRARLNGFRSLGLPAEDKNGLTKSGSLLLKTAPESVMTI